MIIDDNAGGTVEADGGYADKDDITSIIDGGIRECVFWPLVLVSFPSAGISRPRALSANLPDRPVGPGLGG